MRNNPLVFRCLALLVAFAVAAMSVPAPAIAAMVKTDQVLDEATTEQVETDRDRLRALLSREGVRAELRDMGLAPEEAVARVDAMSDGEVAMLAGQVDKLAAGQASAFWEVADGVSLLLHVAVLVLMSMIILAVFFPFV